MSQQETKFQLHLNIKRGDGNASIYYKQDGRRFDSDNTIKMKVQTPYKFLVTLRPPLKIKLALLKGEELQLVAEETNPECSRYSYSWTSSHVITTKKNRRLNFNLILEIQDLGVLEIPLQLKFYDAADTSHSAWGKCLHHIEFECTFKAGSSFVEIQKQVYR